MMSWGAALVALLTTGCGAASEGKEDWREQPLATVVANRTFKLEMNGFSGNSYEYEIDPTTWTLHGVRITVAYVKGARVSTRSRVDSAHMIAGTPVADAFAHATIGVIGGEACDALREEASKITVDGDFAVLSVGTEVHGGLNACERSNLYPLATAVEQAFDAMHPTQDTVEWDGQGYKTVTP